MKKLYELKNLFGIFKEEATAIDITLDDDTTQPIERLRLIAKDMLNKPWDKIESNDEIVMEVTEGLAGERIEQIEDIRRLLNYYEAIYKRIFSTAKLAKRIERERSTKVSK